MSYIPRLRKQYQEEVVPTLQKQFGFKSVMRVPKIEKIVISQGIGEAVADKKIIDGAIEDVTAITGQKPIATVSKKDVSNFKLRKGMPIGTKVRSEEHTSELQSRPHLVCRLLLEKKKNKTIKSYIRFLKN